MSVELDGDHIRLTGPCRVEDAEALLVLLQSDRTRPVDVANVLHMHAAVLQVLFAFRPNLMGSPQDAFIEQWLMPLLRRNAVE
jgi:hypothetical protein